jgi:hypothetical protein
VDDLCLSDPVAQRVGRLFADLMETLADGGDSGAEAARSVAVLWRSGHSGPWSVELDPDILVHGIGAVAAALAEELVAARRSAGTPAASVAAVWQEVGTALEPSRPDDLGAGGDVIDLPRG